MIERISKRYRADGIIPFLEGGPGRVVHVKKDEHNRFVSTVKRDDGTTETYSSLCELDEAVYPPSW